MSFKNWLEMAVVNTRKSISLDEGDIEYLNQFDPRFWNEALKRRYNDFLFMALDGQGNIKPDFNDVQTLTLGISRGFKDVTINTGTIKLIDKLKKLGFDLRGMNDQTKTGLYFQPLAKPVAIQIMHRWKQLSGKDGLKPNVTSWTPNYRQARRDDVEPVGMPNSREGRKQYEELKQEIEASIEITLDNAGTRAGIGYHSLNSLYWKQPNQFAELVSAILERVWLNWNDPQMHDERYRGKFIFGLISNALQNGIISRRKFDYFTNNGFDPWTLHGKYKPEKMKQILQGDLDALKSTYGGYGE